MFVAYVSKKAVLQSDNPGGLPLEGLLITLATLPEGACGYKIWFNPMTLHYEVGYELPVLGADKCEGSPVMAGTPQVIDSNAVLEMEKQVRKANAGDPEK